jgi:cation transport protein ChaC
MKDEHVLTRALIESGAIDAMVAKAVPDLKLLTEAERAASIRATLAARPPGDAWLFGYGSLIWNPTIRSVERRTARIDSWHRAFCLSLRMGRGTQERPGLMLALDAGGSCTGVAFRIAEGVLEEELRLIWRREMLADGYVPQWLDVLDEQGVRFSSAIAFTVNATCAQYVGNLAGDVIVERLATASGDLGSNADYLFRTRDGLRAEGILDPELERLAANVEAARAVNGKK